MKQAARAQLIVFFSFFRFIESKESVSCRGSNKEHPKTL
jgi:hypothetical protein